MKIVLVACARKKRYGKHRAKDLYDSALFKKSVAFAKSNGDRWFILSAKHHLLDPEKFVKNYNLSLKMLSREQQRNWAKNVIRSLMRYSKPSDKIIFLTGALYQRDLTPELRKVGYNVQVPLEGKTIGKRLQWLGRN